MPSDIDSLISRVIEQWDQHDRFRDFDKSGEPTEVTLARELARVRAAAKAWEREAEEIESGDPERQSVEPDWLRAKAAEVLGGKSDG